MTAKLSTGARTILMSAGTSREGAQTYARGDTAGHDELVRHGLIGPKGGLTRKGSIARERYVDAILDAFNI